MGVQRIEIVRCGFSCIMSTFYFKVSLELNCVFPSSLIWKSRSGLGA